MLSHLIVSGEIMQPVRFSRGARFHAALPVGGALAAAVAFGVAEQQANQHDLPILTAMSAMSAPWLLLPFLIGAVRPRRPGVALLGFAATGLAVSAYAAMSGDPTDGLSGGHAHLSLAGALPFLALLVLAHGPAFLAAAVSGPLYAVLGHRWRVSRSWPPALAVTVPIMVEPAARWLAGHSVLFWAADPPAAYAEGLTGLALTAAAIVIAVRHGRAQQPGTPPERRRLTACAFRIAGTVVVAVGVVVFWSPPIFPQVYAAGNGASALALAPGGRTLYVVNYPYRFGAAPSLPPAVTPVDTATMQAGRPIEVAQAGWQISQALVTRSGLTMYAVVVDVNAERNSWVASVNLLTGARSGIQVPGGADEIALSPDGRTLYISTLNDAIVPVSVATGRAGHIIELPTSLGDSGATPDHLALAPDGRTLYVDLSGSDDEIVAIDTATGQAAPWAYQANDVNGMAVAPDGRTLYLTIDGDSYDGDIIPGPRYLVAVNSATGALVSTPLALSDEPVATAVTPDGRDLVVLGLDSVTLTRLAAGTGAPTGPVSVGGWFPHSAGTDLAISPDGRTLYVSASDGTSPGGVEVFRLK